MHQYTLGLFSNMYPPSPPKKPNGVILTDTTRGIFIKRMVDDLESQGVIVKKAVKRSGSLMGYVPFLYQSLNLARNGSIDIMQAEYIPHSSFIPVLFKRKTCPLVLKFHGDDARIFPFKNSLCMSLTRTMVQKSDYILTSSEDIRTILISLGALPEKITSLHSGVDTTFFSPRDRVAVRQKFGLPECATVFLFVGRLHAWKGINEILSVATLCPNETFVFIGPGTIPAHSKNCMFVGSLQPESVRDWYNAADCLLLPSYTEGFPTVIMEAFSCGTPVIATNVGGCLEMVEPGKTGVLIPVRDIPTLHDAVVWMGNHADERMRMGIIARSVAVERFDHVQMTRKLMSIHKKLIQIE